MILRRLADGISQQDWFTVVVEVLIVVVGIFLGLQVDDWNEARKDRAAEAEYLARLSAETDSNLEQVRDKAQSYLARAASLERIVEALGAGRLESLAEEDLTRAFCYWYVPESVRLQSATYDEMTATGGLELIRDREVREGLQLVWAEHERVRAENPKLAAVQIELAKRLRAFTRWRFGAPAQVIDINTAESADPSRAGCDVDRETLAAHPEVASVLVQLNRSQTILAALHIDEKKALETLRAALGRAGPDETVVPSPAGTGRD